MDLLNNAIQQGIAPAIVVAIYLIITKFIDSKKENAQIKLNSELTKSINTINNFIVTITKDIIEKDKEKCKNAINDSIYAFGMKLMNFVATTIINNHIDANKTNIIANIHNIVNGEYYAMYSALSIYVVNDIRVSDMLKTEWISSIEKDMIDIIYKTNLSKEDKILSFNNKINIKLHSYISDVINHTIKG